MKKNWLNKILLLFFINIFLVACSSNIKAVNNQNIVISNQNTPIVEGINENEIMSTTTEDKSNDSFPNYDQYEIITLLPFDAIPAIDNPEFLSADQADSEYAPDELVIGVEFNGEARAYSINYLSRHEIVNDTVGGRQIAVTW